MPSYSTGLIAIIGIPGSGKSTVGSALADLLDYAYLGLGDLLRGRAKIADDVGQGISRLLSQGEMVPDEIVLEVLFNWLESRDTPRRLVADGVPRTERQLEVLRTSVGLTDVVLLEVSDETAMIRLNQRAAASPRLDDSLVVHRSAALQEELEKVVSMSEMIGLLRRIDASRSVAHVVGSALKAVSA